MSYAECDCSADIDGGSKAYQRFDRRARKDHTCCECGEVIHKGQRYVEETGVYDGGCDRFRTCLPCIAIRERYCSHGWYYGELRNQIMDCLGFDYTEVPPEDEWEEIDAEDAKRVEEYGGKP